MNITKKQESGFSQKYYVGAFTGRVVMINPTVQELTEYRGATPKDDAKEINYSGKTQNGDEFVSIHFYIQPEYLDAPLLVRKFMFIDKPVESKDKAPQWVNQVGMASYCANKRDLADWFTDFTDFNTKEKIADKEIRQAFQGESKFYEFLTEWMSSVNYFEPSTKIWIDDKKKFFNNIDKYVKEQYQPLVKAEKKWLDATDKETRAKLAEDVYTGVIAGLATVSCKESSESVKYYQGVYDSFFGGKKVQGFLNNVRTQLWRKDVKKNGKDGIYLRWFKQVTEGEYQLKDLYELCIFKEIDLANFTQYSNETFIPPVEEKQTVANEDLY